MIREPIANTLLKDAPDDSRIVDQGNHTHRSALYASALRTFERIGFMDWISRAQVAFARAAISLTGSSVARVSWPFSARSPEGEGENNVHYLPVGSVSAQNSSTDSTYPPRPAPRRLQAKACIFLCAGWVDGCINR